jgi:fluoride ion exporter CrcB/FEX
MNKKSLIILIIGLIGCLIIGYRIETILCNRIGFFIIGIWAEWQYQNVKNNNKKSDKKEISL